ncbi:MAG TPA: hypothetical protein VGL02_07520, partial [Streptomyces sp.]
MRRRAMGAAAATAAALCLTCVPAAQTVAMTPAAAPAAAPQAQAWVTTADGAQRMQRQPPVTFQAGTSDLTTITVDPNQTFQRMDGFGGALTDSSAA